MNGKSALSHQQNKKKVLLVEDEQELANLVLLNLSLLDLDVVHCSTICHAKTLLSSTHFDAILLDRMLPDGDGLMLCMELSKANSQTPIMMLTAKADETDIVLGLESGADDYLAKPFSVLELRARVKAMLRRSLKVQLHSALPSQHIEHGLIRIDGDTREVFAENRSVDLTATEFDLLHYLATHPQQVFSRLQLLEAVWGYNYDGYEHTVNSHINRLRSKLSRHCGNQDLVKTVWGVGYKFSPPEAQVA
ncbi:response regulator transcription factor [Shewanella sp. 202IG2-18]|uniref:response regulator transcription factor n=1 Tax=Parashewanella hymeniacidonis TaxID=2807618 RepID=UPI00195F7E49|nr:response regulator transcription factor [Parashewanella hymeniacidonis]MBM7073557.1 response regulator transcription factor [Parashewanella hymeniacidonis]